MAVLDEGWANAPARGWADTIAARARAIAVLDGWRRLLLAVLAGALVGLAHAPFDWPLTLFVAFPMLVLLLDGAEPVRRWSPGRLIAPALIGWAFGFGMYASGLWWLGNALVVSGSAPALVAPLAGFALAAVLALFPAAAAALARLLWGRGASRIVMLAGAWALLEAARAVVATGFPWLAVGYAAMPVPALMQSVAVIGMDGMNALAVLAAASPVLLLERRTRWLGIVLPVALVTAHAAWGQWRLATVEVEGTQTLVRVVQPAVPQDEKWDGDAKVAVLQALLDLSVATPDTLRGVEPRRPDWIVWPETAFPFALSETPEARAILADALDRGQTLLAGGTRAEGIGPDRLWFNALYAVSDDGRVIATRDKVHLVPFGEYLPLPELFERLGMRRVVEAAADFTPALRRETLALPGAPVILPLICYEAIFPRALQAAGPNAEVLLNITNDAWFGTTPGPHQHMRQARVRAVEAGLPMVRAANDGVSAVIDPLGRVVDGLSHGERGAFEAFLPAPLPVEVANRYSIAQQIPWGWLLLVLAAAMGLAEAWTERRRRA